MPKGQQSRPALDLSDHFVLAALIVLSFSIHIVQVDLHIGHAEDIEVVVFGLERVHMIIVQRRVRESVLMDGSARTIERITNLHAAGFINILGNIGDSFAYIIRTFMKLHKTLEVNSYSSRHIRSPRLAARTPSGNGDVEAVSVSKIV